MKTAYKIIMELFKTEPDVVDYNYQGIEHIVLVLAQNADLFCWILESPISNLYHNLLNSIL